MVALAYVASSCVGVKHLKEGEYLLYNQKITVARKDLREDLQKQLLQKPNSRVWFLPIAPYSFVYYQGLKTYDTARYERQKAVVIRKFTDKMAPGDISVRKKDRLQKRQDKKITRLNKKIDAGNLMMRWGEPLVVFDSAQVEKSQRNLAIYMQSNGWFLTRVDYQVHFEDKIARVNYRVNEGPRYTIDTIFYDIPDTAVRQLIMANNRQSKLKTGSPYSQDNLKAERERIDLLLKDNGYFDFTRQYINYRVDTTLGQHKVAVQLRLLNPANLSRHKSFRIDSVVFSLDVNNIASVQRQKSFTYNGVTYNFYDRYYAEKVLGRRIHLKPGEVYSRAKTLNTQRELAGVDMFKFVNINYDTTGGKFLANIFVSPLHRYQWSAEAGLTVTQFVPGPFASINLKQRNVFNTLGILQIGGNIGVEGVAAASNPNDVLASLEAGASVSLTFPRFFLPFSDPTKVKLGFYNPKTSISVGLSFTDRPEYTRANLLATNAYTWQPNQRTLFDFKLLEIGLIRTTNLDRAYYDRLLDLEQNGNNLINSFKPSFVINQRLTRSVKTNDYGRGFNSSSYFSIMFEPGGTFTNLWARDFFARDSLEIYAYLKLDSDYRQVVSLGKKKAWAFRVRAGVAYPYGENALMPYEKYFFAGGSIGNRAWKPRRLGPGSYDHIEEDGRVSYRFEQQGEIILESSIEYRQYLIGFLQWAAFVDVGNIWTIREDNTRPGAQFKLNRFYQEIAVGAGMGLRFDFTFFIMRFDVAGKVYDPARPLGKRFVLSPGFRDPPFDIRQNTEPLIYTLSIGYPF